MQVYTQRDSFNPKYHTVIIDQTLHRPVVFPNFAEPMCFSETGRYCILATKKEFTIKRDPFLTATEKEGEAGDGKVKTSGKEDGDKEEDEEDDGDKDVNEDGGDVGGDADGDGDADRDGDGDADGDGDGDGEGKGNVKEKATKKIGMQFLVA